MVPRYFTHRLDYDMPFFGGIAHFLRNTFCPGWCYVRWSQMAHCSDYATGSMRVWEYSRRGLV